MVAMLDLQISADTFTSSILSTLRRTPRCLPALAAGFQLQRVRYRAVSLRHDTESSFRVWGDPDSWTIGVNWEWITALQTQIAVDVIVDVVADADIAAHPNQVVPPTVSIEGTVIFDLDCHPAAPIGWLELQATFVDVEVPAAAVLPTGLPAKPWIVNQLRELLTIPPQRMDMSASLPAGEWFHNAGVTVDRSGSRLAIRAEQPMGGRGDARWSNFLNGFIEDGLGTNEWSIVVGSADLKLTLFTKVFNELTAALKNPDAELISVAVDYSASPGHAVFTVAPYLRFLDVDTEAIPIRLDISLDPVTGHLIVDVDAYGIRDLVDSVLGILTVIINLLMPIVGWLVSTALHDVVSNATHFVSAAVPDLAAGHLDGAPDGTTLQELPGPPFRYRASIPIAVPSGVTGRINELITSPDSVAFAGSWNVLDFFEGPLAVDVSDFGWSAPSIACGAAGEAVYKHIAEEPKKYAHLYSQIDLSTTGSAPIRLCDVSVLSPLDPQLGVDISWTSTTLPTTVSITAPASAEGGLPDPLTLAVRTSAGVFRAEMAAPGPITKADINRLRSLVGVQLEFCDSIILPPWFGGEGKFDLSWIVDPLVDPDRLNTLVDVVTLEVDGLASGATLVLADDQERELASSVVSAGTQTRISLARSPIGPAPSASVRLSRDTRLRSTGAQSDTGVRVTRERLEIAGRLQVSERVHQVTAAPALGAAQFLLLQSDGCLQLDTRHAANPTIAAQWKVPGLRAVIPMPAGVLAFGDGGSFQFDAKRSACTERLGREPMLLASGGTRFIAAAGRDRVDVLNAAGGLIAQIALSACPTGVLVVGRQLLLSTEAATYVYDITDQAVEARQRLEDLRCLRLVRSGLDGAVYGVGNDGRVVTFIADRGEWSRIGGYTAEPWTAGAATAGRTVVHRGDGFAVTVLRRPPRATIVPVRSAAADRTHASSEAARPAARATRSRRRS